MDEETGFSFAYHYRIHGADRWAFEYPHINLALHPTRFFCYSLYMQHNFYVRFVFQKPLGRWPCLMIGSTNLTLATRILK